MDSVPWFQAVEVVHRLPDRLRLRLRPAAGTALDTDRLERLTRDLKGVSMVRVNGRARSLVIHFDPARTNCDRLVAGVRAFPKPVGDPSPRHADAGGLGGVASSLATLILAPTLPLPLKQTVSTVAALPLLRHALAELPEGGITSHVLEAMAVAISLARSDTTAANTTTFMLALGEYLEDSIARRSDDLLRNLLRPADDTIWVLRDGVEQQIPADQVIEGETVIVGAGTVIPVDGTVLGGEAQVNEATMTGEAVPVSKSRGGTVLSGTVVEDGRLEIYAEKVGADTATARIADYVQQSLTVKSQSQLEAAQMADRLVPTVLKLAGAALVVSGDWRRAASVLQADYSCALKLATPVAFKSAMYAAGRAGILVKGADALERLAQADTFVFDKTGTLTTGSLQVTEALTFDESFSPHDLICLAASVEEHYVHPMAQAVVAAAQTNGHRHFDHQEVQFVVAHGVASIIEGKRVVVGSRHFVEEDEGIDLSPCRDEAKRLYRQGRTLLYIGFGGRLLGLLALQDHVRANAAATISRLRRLGVRRILMLTGDHAERAAETAAQLGLDGFHAQLLPEDKARIIETLHAEGGRIAFIGDGINDAPALAGAHVGIAMQQGADIARLTADVALLEDDLSRVADAKAAANATQDLIRANYRATVGLNSAILGAAALGLLSPIATALLHNGSTIAILLNALRRRQT